MTVIGSSTQRREIVDSDGEKATVVLSWGVATDVGHKRNHNEDSLVADGTIFAVADGMGGHAAGDVASRAVVSRLADHGDAVFVDVDTVMHALRAATMDISHTIDEQQLGVGTTVTGVALSRRERQPYWVVFNVGDSRVYFFERERLTQVTVDHSVVQELVSAGLISAADAENHPDSNVVTRAVGFNAEPVADFWLIPVSAGLRILVCSDGLTREVSERMLSVHLAAGLDAHETAHALIDAALAEGGRDNITAIVVDVVEAEVESGHALPDGEQTSPRR